MFKRFQDYNFLACTKLSWYGKLIVRVLKSDEFLYEYIHN